MKHNVGTIDKVVRFLIGAALLSQVFWGAQTPWGWIGLGLIATAFMSFCPLYLAIGMSTQKK